MTILLNAVAVILTANAILAFCIAFYFQIKVIQKVFGASDHEDSFIPWKALANPNSPQVNMGRFIAGQLYPELRRKWGRAVLYTVVSYATMFAYLGMMKLLGSASVG